MGTLVKMLLVLCLAAVSISAIEGEGKLISRVVHRSLHRMETL